MISKRQSILSNDWQILKAKYILKPDFAIHKKDFLALCELESFEALSLYVLMNDLGRNEKIDNMILGYPNVSPRDTLYKVNRGQADMEDYFRSLVRDSFVERYKLSEKNTGDYVMVGAIGSQSEVVGRQTNESFLSMLKKDTPSDYKYKDSIYLSYIASIAVNEQYFTSTTIWLLNAIANQPYSEIMQRYMEENKNGDGESSK